MRAVIEALRSRWMFVSLITVLFVAGVTLAVERLPSQYDGRSVVAISPRSDVPAGGVDAVRILGPKYVPIATAPDTLAAAAREIDVDPMMLDGAVQASLARDTGNLSITARLDSPQRAAAAANAVAAAVVAAAEQDRLLHVELVVEASPPRGPATPPRRLLEGLAIVLGFCIGLALALVSERVKPRVRTWKQVSGIAGQDVLARIPRLRRIGSDPVQALDDPAVAASVVTLRTAVERALDEGCVSIALTSPGRGDGKTTTCVLLADVLASVGRRVLLVEGDVHRPRLADVAGVPLEDARPVRVVTSTDLVNETRPGWRDGVAVLPAPRDSDAAEGFTRRLSDVTRAAEPLFDLVIIDGPPILYGHADGLETGARAAIVVVTIGRPAEDVVDAFRVLETLRVTTLGVVVNRTKAPRADRF